MRAARRRRLQWAVRTTLTLGVTASVAANILHARDNPISQAIAAWPPLALLITVELVSRVPIGRRGLGVVRVVSTATIAGIAAWVSYWHMAGVVARYGETGTVPYLLPLSVDGLIIVASVSLVELAGRRADTPPGPAPATESAAEPTRSPAGEAPATATASASAGLTMPPVTAPAGGSDPTPEQQDNPATDPIPDQTRTGDLPATAEPAPEPAHEPSPDEDGDTDNDDDQQDDEDDVNDDLDLAADLVPLLPAARAARDELISEGRTVSRDALARRLRRNGHAIRNNRVSELLTALRSKQASLDGAHPTAAT